MKLILLFLSISFLCGQSIGGGISVASSSKMGYEQPIVGGWLRGQLGPLRTLGEVDNSQKWWVKDGLSWRITSSLDTPDYRGLSALGIMEFRQHRNSQWTKRGFSVGPGVRYKYLYSYYLFPDSSPNRTSSLAAGVEIIRKHIFVQSEYRSYWFCCTGGSSGWSISTRLGYIF